MSRLERAQAALSLEARGGRRPGPPLHRRTPPHPPTQPSPTPPVSHALPPLPPRKNQKNNSWGPVVQQHNATAAAAAAGDASSAAASGPVLRTTHRLYLSEQTEQAKLDPPKLIAVDCDVARPCVASANALAAWNEYGRAASLRVVKTVIHPGEVNKIRELPTHPHVVVTHTDSPELYVWNMETQPDVRPKAAAQAAPGMAGAGPAGSAAGGPSGGGLTASGAGVVWPTQPSVADAVLRGHKQDAQFPLATSGAPSAGGPSLVASGGQDRLVLLWSLADVASSALAGGGGGGTGCGAGGGASAGGGGAPSSATRGGGAGRGPTPIEARVRLEGHADTVEDVVFRPGSSEVLASVGDDKCALFWDTRAAAKGPVCAINDAHGSSADVHCVDWSALSEHLVATGAADGSVRVWDVRALSSALSAGTGGGGAGGRAAAAGAAAAVPACVRTWKGAHTAAVMRVEWHPHVPGVFATGGEDHTVLLWRLDLAAGGGGGAADGGAAEGAAPAGAAEAAADDGAVGRRGGGGLAPKELLFRHVGHRQGRVIDFQWCPNDDWLLCSVSDDTSAAAPDAPAVAAAAAAAAAAAEAAPPAVVPRGGGTLQVWRVNDLLYRAEDDVVGELERHREWIVSGVGAGAGAPAAAAAAPAAAAPAAAAPAAAATAGKE